MALFNIHQGLCSQCSSSGRLSYFPGGFFSSARSWSRNNTNSSLRELCYLHNVKGNDDTFIKFIEPISIAPQFI